MPALGLLELESIAAGVAVGDAMVKCAPLEELITGTVHPGKYLVLVLGDVASVDEAMEAGRDAVVLQGATLLDEIFLADPHEQVLAALRGARRDGGGEAVGVVELCTVASVLGVADRGVKGAAVDLRELRLADALGGKSYCVFSGIVSEVEAAVELAIEGLRRSDVLAGQVVIPQIHDEMDANLLGAADFRSRLGAAGSF